MRRMGLILLLGTVGVAGCSQESRSPDAIRIDTANATSAATRDAKAVVLGVFDGLRRKGAVNINRANPDQLASLPGITPARAEAIIAHRPYQSGEDLVRRHILSRSEYSRIVDRISAR